MAFSRESRASRVARASHLSGRLYHLRRARIAALAGLPLLLAAALAGCAGGMSTAGPHATTTLAATATATPVPCATRATATGEAWVSGQQVAGRVNGGPVTTLSAFTYPLGIPDEGAVGNAPRPAFLAWAPDGAHLAVLIAQDVPFSTAYYPYVVDVATHATARVPLAGSLTVPSQRGNQRIVAWADAHTLLIFGDPNGTAGSPQPTVRYDLTTSSVTPLPGVADALEGVVRCGTLFYRQDDARAPLAGSTNPNHFTVGPARLHRYNLATSAEIGSPVALGDQWTYGGAEGQVERPGWDVSADGTRLAYQHLALTVPSPADVKNVSTWFSAHADGSAATPILPAATSDNGAYLTISPDGAQVAVTNANPAPNVISGPLAGGSARFYTPAAYAMPAWKADGSGFYAGSGPSFAPDSVTLYPLGAGDHASGSSAYSSASAIATLP